MCGGVDQISTKPFYVSNLNSKALDGRFENKNFYFRLDDIEIVFVGDGIDDDDFVLQIESNQ